MMMITSFLVVILFLASFLKNLWVVVEVFMIMGSLAVFWVFLNHSVGLEVFSNFFFFDWMSWSLILLTFFITFMMITGSYLGIKFFKKNSAVFVFLSFFMSLMLMLSFLSMSPILFYIYFEASLIPIFLLIMGWGYQPERLQASIYMLFYTLFASLPLLLVVLLLNEEFFSFFVKTNLNFSQNFNFLILFFFILAFLIKLPMYGVHLWLPKAHVEAPVAGSMILAGVLLKLGSYGLWRVVFIVSKNFITISSMMLVMGLLGGVIASFVCSVQVDMKALVAYSSVVHMGILLAGVSSLFLYGYEGALCMMLGHGVVSSGLFYLVGTMYDRLGSRSLFVSKGLMIVFPSLTILWFILCIYNISAPPSLALLSEILLTSSILKWSSMTFLFLMMMNFMSMVYTFYMYSQTQQGKINSSIFSSEMLSSREYSVGIFHSLSMSILFLIFWLF